MRLLTKAVALVVALGATMAAHADTIDVFNLNSTMQNGYTAQGTVNMDVTSGVVETSNIGIYLGGKLVDAFTTLGGSNGIQGSFTPSFYFAQFGTASNWFWLALPGSQLVGYKGGQLCSLSSECGFETSGFDSPVYGFYQTQSGTLTLASTTTVAATPEPSSLALLGTGLLGLAGVARRRFLRA